MDLDFAFVCNYAEHVGENVSALGIGFNSFRAQALPYTHPVFYFVAQLRMSASEAGRKAVELQLFDAQDKAVIPPVTGSIEPPTPITPGMTQVIIKLGSAFWNVQFTQYGHYSLRFSIDGVEIKRIPLEVVPLPLPTTGSS